MIAAAMLKSPEVATAVLFRGESDKREFLLTYHPHYGYFLPSARCTSGTLPEGMAVRAIEWDTSYTGEVKVKWCSEVPDVHTSWRYEPHKATFRFHICKVTLPGVDLLLPNNALEKALNALQAAKIGAEHPLGSRGYWGWFTESQIRGDTDISPTMGAVLSAAIRAADNC